MNADEKQPRNRLRKYVALGVLVLVGVNVFCAVMPYVGSRYDEWQCTHCGATILHWQPLPHRTSVSFPESFDTHKHQWVRKGRSVLQFWTWLDTLVRPLDVEQMFDNAATVQPSSQAGLLSAYLLEDDPLSDKAHTALQAEIITTCFNPTRHRLALLGVEILSSVDGEMKIKGVERLGRFCLTRFDSLDEAKAFLEENTGQ